ncbi:MAG: DUF3418 domain-containing protein, partial [Nakamurella sp.]
VSNTVGGHQVTGYPALVDEGTTVGLQVFTSEADQRRAMRAGIRRLLVLAAPGQVGQLRQSLTREQLLTLAVTPYGSVGTLVADATEAAIDALLDWAGGLAWTAEDFGRLRAKIAPHLNKAVRDVMVAGEQALRAGQAAAQAIDTAARAASAGSFPDLLADMRAQLDAALAPGFLTRTGAAGLPDLTRQLQALAVRAERVVAGPARDRERLAELLTLRRETDAAVQLLPPERQQDADVTAVYRLLDEFRVAQFAQPMRTAVPVSAKRIRAAVAALRP